MATQYVYYDSDSSDDEYVSVNWHTSSHEGSYGNSEGPGPSHHQYNENYCAVCKNSFFSTETAPTRMTKCGHKLHLVCMNKWLPEKKKCPVCDTKIKNWKDITNKCVVCLDSLTDGEPILISDCNHEFHEDCLRQWLPYKKRCPICRRNISYMEEELEGSAQSGDNGDYFDEQPYDDQSEYEEYSDESGSEEIDPDLVCIYCSERFNDSNLPTKALHCGHYFHLYCMNRYLPAEKKCAVCEAPVYKWINTNNLCVVCNVKFKPKDKRRVSMCHHEMHQHCMEFWLKSNNRCPLCKCKVVGTNSTDNECVICLESFNGSSVGSRRTPCKHKFHNVCLDTWLQNENICPICRRRL